MDDFPYSFFIDRFMTTGGFGSYLFGMSERVAQQSENTNVGFDYKNPALGWMIGFLFVVSFLGLFSVVPLRKVVFLQPSRRNCCNHIFMFLLFPDHDYRLQVDISKWYCHCISH